MAVVGGNSIVGELLLKIIRPVLGLFGLKIIRLRIRAFRFKFTNYYIAVNIKSDRS